MTIEKLHRHIKLAPRRVERKGAQQTGNREGYPCRCRDRFHVGAGKNLGGESKQRRGRFAGVGFEIGNRRYRVIIKIEAARLDEIDQLGRGKAIALDRGEKRRGDRIGARLLVAVAVDDVAPPLQPDFPGQRLARHFADAGNLAVEGVQRVDRATVFRRCE